MHINRHIVATAAVVLGASIGAQAAPAAVAPSHATEMVQGHTGVKPHSFPAVPKPKVNGPLERTAVAPGAVNRTSTPAGTKVKVHRGAPTVSPKMFGTIGTYAGKRNLMVQWVNYIYARNIPTIGGTYRAPAVYELPAGSYFGCSGGFSAAAYCPATNIVAIEAAFMQPVFTRFGDSAVATAIAHEFGHGAERWLGFSNRGKFRYTLYGEGFADCMAGGFMASMYNLGRLDNLGRGDGQEMLDLMALVANATTTLDNHGNVAWRQALARYGWTYGMAGCAAWGRQLVRS